MAINDRDKGILRELGKQVAEIAALPVQQETISRWKALNGLRPVRPMVMIDQLPWNEMDVDGELVLQTTDPFARELETRMRQTIYKWKHLRVDMVMEPVIEVFKVIRGCDFGVRGVENVAVTDPQNSVISHYYLDQLKTDEDIEKIKDPVVTLDKTATDELEEQTHGVFDGILRTRMQGFVPNFSPWDSLCSWRGPEDIVWDLADRPEFTHRLMSRLTDAFISLLDQLEDQGLLTTEQSIVHCSHTYCDELPAPGYDPKKPRAKDLWTAGMAQIFSTVSPAMHQEFELAYAERWYKRFGLVYYGCCEPLDNKMDIVRKIPLLRKISMSPWVDQDKGASQIGKDFVFYRKSNPAFLAVDDWNPEAVRKDLQQTLDACAPYGCPVEFILKDVSTTRYQPQRVWEWADVAMEVVGG